MNKDVQATPEPSVRALLAQWREKARRVRPLEDAPLTAEKRARIAEWMWYTNRANELEAALAADARQVADLEAEMRRFAEANWRYSFMKKQALAWAARLRKLHE